MGKFSEVIEKNIEYQASLYEGQFFKEFDLLLHKYGISNSVKFYGLEYYNKEAPQDYKGDKTNYWRQHIKSIFIQIKTEEFINKMQEIQHYFE